MTLLELAILLRQMAGNYVHSSNAVLVSAAEACIELDDKRGARYGDDILDGSCDPELSRKTDEALSRIP